MAIIHIVQFRFKKELGAEKINEICSEMLALKDQCIHPTTQKPYIKDVYGGSECSVEGLAKGVTHVFVVEFESAADRKYYALEDPRHVEFARFCGTVSTNTDVVDFERGVFI